MPVEIYLLGLACFLNSQPYNSMVDPIISIMLLMHKFSASLFRSLFCFFFVFFFFDRYINEDKVHKCFQGFHFAFALKLFWF